MKLFDLLLCSSNLLKPTKSAVQKFTGKRKWHCWIRTIENDDEQSGIASRNCHWRSQYHLLSAEFCFSFQMLIYNFVYIWSRLRLKGTKIKRPHFSSADLERRSRSSRMHDGCLAMWTHDAVHLLWHRTRRGRLEATGDILQSSSRTSV